MHDRIIDGSILSGDPGHCVGASGLEAGKILLEGTVSARILPGTGRGCVPAFGAQIPIELFRLPVPAPLKAECRPADHKHQQREQYPGSEPVLCLFSPPLPASSAGPDRIPIHSVPVHQCNSRERQHSLLSPLDCLPAKASRTVNDGAYAPFILTVDWLDWLCYDNIVISNALTAKGTNQTDYVWFLHLRYRDLAYSQPDNLTKIPWIDTQIPH